MISKMQVYEQKHFVILVLLTCNQISSLSIREDEQKHVQTPTRHDAYEQTLLQIREPCWSHNIHTFRNGCPPRGDQPIGMQTRNYKHSRSLFIRHTHAFHISLSTLPLIGLQRKQTCTLCDAIHQSKQKHNTIYARYRWDFFSSYHGGSSTAPTRSPFCRTPRSKFSVFNLRQKLHKTPVPIVRLLGFYFPCHSLIRLILSKSVDLSSILCFRSLLSCIFVRNLQEFAGREPSSSYARLYR